MTANAEITRSESLLDALRRSRSGDAEAFAVVVREHQSYAYALAIRLLSNADDAEDVMQEAFIRVWTHLRRYDEGVAFSTWLYTIVTNLCRDRLRARKRIRRYFPSSSAQSASGEKEISGPDSFQSQSDRDLIEKLGVLLQRLTVNQRLVYTLRDLQELSIDETAAVTGLTAASVKTHLSAARRRLREFFQRHYDVEDLS